MVAKASANGTPGSGRFSLANARAEAKGEPFVIDVAPDITISIEPPTVDQLFEMQDGVRSEDVRATLKGLCGDAYPAVMGEIGNDQSVVLEQLSEALVAHFGLGGSPASPS